MSFSGKKYRRIGCENIDEFMKGSNTNHYVIQMLKHYAPTFSFTRLDERAFKFTLQSESHILMTYNFRLDEEFEMERLDGGKIRLTYTLESENVLIQVIKQRDGKISHLRRVFQDNGAEMTIKVEGTDIKAKIYYEVVE